MCNTVGDVVGFISSEGSAVGTEIGESSCTFDGFAVKVYVGSEVFLLS